MTVEFEWDEEKNWSNDAKHGLSFEIAALVFEDPEAVSFLDDRFDFGEKRWVTLGRIDFAIIYVAHNSRGGRRWRRNLPYRIREANDGA